MNRFAPSTELEYIPYSNLTKHAPFRQSIDSPKNQTNPNVPEFLGFWEIKLGSFRP